MHQAVGEISIELKSILAIEDEQRIFGDRIINAIFNKVEKENQDLWEEISINFINSGAVTL